MNGHVHVLLLELDLAHRRVGRAVRGDDAVLAEVLVGGRRGRAEVAAIGEVVAADRGVVTRDARPRDHDVLARGGAQLPRPGLAIGR